MGLLSEFLSALYGGASRSKKKNDDESWLEECEECGEHYYDCECDDCGDEDCKNW